MHLTSHASRPLSLRLRPPARIFARISRQDTQVEEGIAYPRQFLTCKPVFKILLCNRSGARAPVCENEFYRHPCNSPLRALKSNNKPDFVVILVRSRGRRRSGNGRCCVSRKRRQQVSRLQAAATGKTKTTTTTTTATLAQHPNNNNNSAPQSRSR